MHQLSCLQEVKKRFTYNIVFKLSKKIMHSTMNKQENWVCESMTTWLTIIWNIGRICRGTCSADRNKGER